MGNDYYFGRKKFYEWKFERCFLLSKFINILKMLINMLETGIKFSWIITNKFIM